MKKIVSAIILGLLLPFSAFAAKQEKIPTGLLTGPGSIIDIISYITDWMFTLLLTLAVIFIIMAAYKYMTSGGGEETGKAHKMLIYAAVAIAVAVLAKGFIAVVRTLVEKVPAQSTSGGTGTTSGTNGSSNGDSADSDFAPLPFTLEDGEAPVDLLIQKCSDKTVSLVMISYTGGNWTNGATTSSRMATIGDFHTGLLSLGTGYTVSAGICSDGAIPVVMVNKAKDSNPNSWERVN